MGFETQSIPTVEVGSDPQAVVAGDLDNDGDLDLAVTNGSMLSTGNFAVSILYNDSFGTLAPTIQGDITVSTNARAQSSISAAHLDCDDRLDLVVALNRSFQQIGVIPGDSGVDQFLALGPTEHINIDGSVSADSIAAADIDQDGLTDIVFSSNFNVATPGVVLHPGCDGRCRSEAFSESEAVFASNSHAPECSSIAAGDLNVDGYPDIVCAHSVNGVGEITVWKNDRTGHFPTDPEVLVGTTSRMENVSIALLDGDARPDLLVGSNNASSDNISLFFNQSAPPSDVDLDTNGVPDVCEGNCVPSQVQCPVATILSSDPGGPAGLAAGEEFLDARYPHVPADASMLLGIDTVRVSLDTTVPATDPSCWALCETAADPSGPNGIVSVLFVSSNSGVTDYDIVLQRPLTAGAVTTLNYISDPAPFVYVSHPANVNADSTAGPGDILSIIDCINGIDTAGNCPWDESLDDISYSSDTDHSGVTGPADILAVIDLLNGASEFQVWNGESRPQNTTCTSVCDAFAGTGGAPAQGPGGPGSSLLSLQASTVSSSEENAAFADGFVKYLMFATTATRIDMSEVAITLEALTGWCVGHFTDAERKALADRIGNAGFDATDAHFRTLIRGVISDLRI